MSESVVRHSETTLKIVVVVRGSFGGVELGKDGLLVIQTFSLTVIFEKKILTRRYFSFQASGPRHHCEVGCRKITLALPSGLPRTCRIV